MPFFGSSTGADPSAAGASSADKEEAIDKLLILCAE